MEYVRCVCLGAAWMKSVGERMRIGFGLYQSCANMGSVWVAVV